MADKPDSSDKLAEKITTASESKELERKIPGYPNLTPWPKGTSGFAGRKHRKWITTEYETLMPQTIPGTKMTYAQAIAKGMARSAIAGDTQATKEITDRLEGKAVQRVEVDMPDAAIDIEAMSDAELKQLIMAEVIRRKAIEEK